MNRSAASSEPYACLHLPHTRGDEPNIIHTNITTIDNLPHTRGDEPEAMVLIDKMTDICPTRVGMNRGCD